MAKNINNQSLPEQEFNFRSSTNVSRSMIKAGTMKRSRISAGLRAAWNAKTSSMFGDDTTKGAKLLRLLGQDNAAKWYDRFLATEKKTKGFKSSSSDEQKRPDKRISNQVSLNTGILKAHGARLNAIHGLLDVVANDVSDIKQLLMPKIVVAKGRKGTEDEGYDQMVQFNPLAPEGSQLNKVSPSGKILPIQPGKNYKNSAVSQAALASAQLALKMQQEDQNRTQIRKKYSYTEKKEQYRQEDPLVTMGKRLKGIEDKLGEKKKEDGGIFKFLTDSIKSIWDKITGMFTMFGPFLKTGLVGFAGYAGYKIGSYLNDHFKLNEKINDIIDKVTGIFDRGRDAAAKKNSFQSKQSLIEDANKKLLGSGWEMVDFGKYQRKSDNKVFTKDELPDEVKGEFKGSGMRGFADWENPRFRNKEGQQETTPLRKQEEPSFKNEKDIKDQIKQHEGLKLEPYKDSKGKWTVGYGHLIGDGSSLPPEWNRKITKEEAEKIFEEDYAKHRKAAANIPGFNKLNAQGKRALIDLTYNMGPNWVREKGFVQFEKAMSALSPDVETAAKSLEKSLWYSQVGRRAPKVVADLRAGADKKYAQTYADNKKIPPTISSGMMDQQSRTMQAQNSAAASLAVLAPVINQKISTTKSTPRNMPKADTLSADSSFIRAAGQDTVHPVKIT